MHGPGMEWVKWGVGMIMMRTAQWDCTGGSYRSGGLVVV